MIRKQLYLSDQMNQKLQQMAKERGVPQSEIIREGLEQYLANNEDKEQLWDQLFVDMKQSKIRDIEWDRNELYKARSKGGETK